MYLHRNRCSALAAAFVASILGCDSIPTMSPTGGGTDAPIPTGSPDPETAFAKWQNPGFFRGANMSASGPAGSISVHDLEDLECAGANLAHFSIPGIQDINPPFADNGFADRLRELVDAAEQTWGDGHGLYYTIAVRSGPGRCDVNEEEKECCVPVASIWDDAIVQDEYADMIATIVSMFHDEPHLVGIAPIVEPNPLTDVCVECPEDIECCECRFADQGDLADRLRDQATPMAELYNGLIAAVRAREQQENRSVPIPILVQAPAWSNPYYFTEELLGGIKDPYIVYEVHNYEPAGFSHDIKTEYDINKSSWVANNGQERTFEDVFRTIIGFQDVLEARSGSRPPVFVGEFGRKFYDQSQSPDRELNYSAEQAEAYFRDQVKIFDEYDWHFAYWNFRSHEFDVSTAACSVWEYVQESWGRANADCTACDHRCPGGARFNPYTTPPCLECSSDSDCAEGEECIDGDCVVIHPCDQVDCDDGDPCTVDSCSGLGVCSSSEVVCPNGSECVDGECVPSTSAGTAVGPLGFSDVFGLAFDRNTNTLYGAVTSGNNELITIDPTTGAGTVVGSIGFSFVSGLAFDPNTSMIYGTVAFIDQLITIDPATGAGTAVGPLGIPSVYGLAFDPSTSMLYGTAASSDHLITIDPATGAATAVGPLGFTDVFGLTFDPNTNTLYGMDTFSDQLITIDRVTGAGTPLGPLGFALVNGLAFDPITSTLYGTDTSSDQLVTRRNSNLPSDGGASQYFEDFEGTVGSEWSVASTDQSPSGRRFLGQFGNEAVTLTLTDLPPHTEVSVELDLYVILSWDGNAFGNGPDQWVLSVDGGPTLLRTTFENNEPENHRQAYPGTYPGGDFPSRTGASENDTLGYGQDSVYAFPNSFHEFTFPHTGSSLTLKFSAELDTLGTAEESWGIDNVEVSIR